MPEDLGHPDRVTVSSTKANEFGLLITDVRGFMAMVAADAGGGALVGAAAFVALERGRSPSLCTDPDGAMEMVASEASAPLDVELYERWSLLFSSDGMGVLEELGRCMAVE